MQARKLFTFITAAAIFIGRSIEGDDVPPRQRAKDAIAEARKRLRRR